MTGLARVTIVSGPRDSGKTRACSALAARFRAEGLSVGGVIAEAECNGGIKTAYSFLDLGAGSRALYARRAPKPPSPGALSYEFLPEGLAFGCAALRRAAAALVDVLFVDEIGPLEMGGGGLWEPMREIASGFGGRIVLTVRPSLIADLRMRLGIEDRDVAVVTPDEAQSGSQASSQASSQALR
jgi:nucleoside-triphosphatase THEP1